MIKEILVTIETNDKNLFSVSLSVFIHRVQHDELTKMSFKNGENCKGLHKGRWFACINLSHEGDGYEVTFKDWSSRFDAILPVNCILPRSLAIDRQSGKRQRLMVNSSKLFPEDEVNMDVVEQRSQPSLKLLIRSWKF